jgi:Mn2+/Fe2+ NRAMP family transporter
MNALLTRLGPGMLFAASAVGVSHLVQSTRAGAEFGLTMAALIIVACLVKYPAFRFGAEYAAVTGEPIIEAYARQGRWLLVFFLLAIAVEGLVVIPAVSLVAAGMTMNLLGISANEIAVTMAIVTISSIALALGRYRLLERVSKLFVAVFAVLTVVATLAAASTFGDGRPLAAPIAATRENLFFSVAVAGWMPVGMGAAVFISLWVCAKSRMLGRPVTVGEARFDFDLGYTGTVVLALCFLLMGTALLFGRGLDVTEGSVGFAGQLVALFTDSVGSWVRVVIGITALAVMFSTVLAVVDGFPRVYANVSRRLLGGVAPAFGEERLYLAFLIVQAAVALALLVYLFATFGVFIDFATTAGFVIAPVIAFLNHRVMGSASVPAEHRPAGWLKAWSAAGVGVLAAASLLYLYFRFGG